jgi:phosphoglycolate phosphatase-like HAD superfamily hydrolase
MERLILFDIDGTLAEGGPAKEAFCVAMEATFGTAGSIGSHSFAGKTDPQIARELLTASGFADPEIDAGFPGLWDGYVSELERRIAHDPMRLLPGIDGLIEALESEPEVALGLVTGNIVRGARLKLGSVGLDGRFGVGGYGSDHEERRHLPGIALGRALELWGVDFPGDRVFVVGDTPRDVLCGQHHGTRTVAVATGHFDREQLEATGADVVLEDLSETTAVLEILLG